jgi:acetolactate synthase-1/2/3 large subunit
VVQTADFEPALQRCLAAGRPALIHLKLDTDVSTSRTTLTALRQAALAKG